MGAKFAPVYATLVLAYLEEKLYNSVHLEFGKDLFENFKTFGKRFLDDIFILWTRS